MKMTKFKGFTIIEVSLVIAIGGLIFLMVFIALPGLRTSQRDTDRRENVLELLDNIKKYQQNNRGALPGQSSLPSTVVWSNELKNSTGDEATWAGFYRDYLGENFVDPSGENYRLKVVNCNSTAVDADCEGADLLAIKEAGFPNDYQMLVVIQASCSGDTAVGSANPRKLAVLFRLEGAGIYCSHI